jgi:hypothetical protein
MIRELLGRAALVAFLLFFAGTGIMAMLDPDRFIRNTGMPKGGEMLKTWNRDSMRVAGAAFVVFAIYMLYHVLVD